MPFANIEKRTVAYRLLGAEANPLVVFAHPLGMTQTVWDEILSQLLPHYRVLTWDLPGHGASQAWPTEGGAITPADLAAEALALADIAGAERFHFVGTSIGGVIGQQLIAAHGERLLTATLTNTGVVIGNAELWNTRAGRVRTEGLAAMTREIVPRWFAPARIEAEPALQDGWCVQMGRGDAESYAGCARCWGGTHSQDACMASVCLSSCSVVLRMRPRRRPRSRHWRRSAIRRRSRSSKGWRMCPLSKRRHASSRHF